MSENNTTGLGARIRSMGIGGFEHVRISQAELRALADRAEALEQERDQYKAGAQELGAYLIDVTAKIALLREMVHAWDTRSADSGKSPYAVLADIREVLA